MRGGAAAVILALHLVGGCSLFENTPKPAVATSDTPEPKDAGPEDKPKAAVVYSAPYTTEQIQNATKNGRTYRYKIEIPNKPPREHVITFRNVDDTGADVYSDDQMKRLDWPALHKDTEFPKDKVTTHDEKLKTPAGKFECIVYEMKSDDEVRTYYFAKKLPGAPVFFYVERGGKRVRTTTLVEYTAGK